MRRRDNMKSAKEVLEYIKSKGIDIIALANKAKENIKIETEKYRIYIKLGRREIVKITYSDYYITYTIDLDYKNNIKMVYNSYNKFIIVDTQEEIDFYNRLDMGYIGEILV